MRRVMSNNQELAHVWAGQKQAEGRGHNLFFEGPSIYSYGRHFEIARFVKGGKVVLFTTRRYSISTAKHILHVRRALRNHENVFDVPSMEDHAGNVRAYLDDVARFKAAALKAVRYASMNADDAGRAARTAAAYCRTFTKDVPAALRKEAYAAARAANSGKLFTFEERAKLDAAELRRAKYEEERAARGAARRAAWEAAEPERAMLRLQDEAEQEDRRRSAPAELEAWARGERDEVPYHAYDLPTRLRLKDGRIETSQNAQITERRARELWAALVRGADVVGVVLDNYTVTSWDGAALRVGCHTIERAEIERMAAILGLPGALPPASGVHLLTMTQRRIDGLA
jgi:hypothetical protein